MNKKPFFIIPALIILHSVVLSLISLYDGPLFYGPQGFKACWPQFFTLLLAIYFAKKMKAKKWGISVIVLAIAGFPRALIAAFPAYTNILVLTTLLLDLVSVITLILAYRSDTFDFSMWEETAKYSKYSYLWKAVILLGFIAGILVYWGRQ